MGHASLKGQPMPTPEFEEIVETFELFDDWEDRYRYVIDLGKAMPEMADDLKSRLTKVDGCVSQVWIAPRLDGSTLHFSGDSDAMIVRGLIAVLHAMLSGRGAADITGTDVIAQLARLGLDQHLSAQRSNGLRAMIKRVQEIAKAAG
jgi:cysteine desulfuration protein SufE